MLGDHFTFYLDFVGLSFVIWSLHRGVQSCVERFLVCALLWHEGVLDCRVLCGMGDTDEDELASNIQSELYLGRNGAKLPSALIKSLSVFYVVIMKISSMDEIDMDSPEEMEEAASEGWKHQYGEDLPRMHALRIRKWAGERSNVTTKDTLAGVSTVGDIGEDDRRLAARKEAGEQLELSPFEREKAVKDMTAQGLSCARIVALSLSLVLGKVSKLSASEDLKYGEDPALCEAAKKARKAGKKLLSAVIKNQNYAEAGAFFSDLMRGYSAYGMIEESSLVASWWAETSGCFSSGDKDMLFDYLDEYFEKYAGRGLPVQIDTVLVTRIRQTGASAAVGKEEFKKLVTKVGELETSVTKLKSDVNTSKQKLESLQNKSAKVTPEEQEERRKRVTCHNCKEKGHFASECPNPKKDE